MTESYQQEQIKRYRIKNFNHRGAVLLLAEKLESEGFDVVKTEPGILTLGDTGNIDEKKLSEILRKYGFEILKDKDLILVEQIKQAVIELIHYMNNMNSVVRKSEYLVEKLGKSYSYLSRVFSAHENNTLEKYIINQKILRIMDLLDEDELTLSEIAYMMDYSSVQYLSNQFRKITGYSVTDYKNDPAGKKQFIG